MITNYIFGKIIGSFYCKRYKETVGIIQECENIVFKKYKNVQYSDRRNKIQVIFFICYSKL